MVVNHSIDPLDRVPISEMRSMVASTKGSRSSSCVSRDEQYVGFLP
jgi:hypothetical protein